VIPAQATAQTPPSERLDDHHESPEVVGRRQRTGVLLLIVADVAFVLSLVFTYFYLRALNTQGGWIPAADPKTASVGFGWVIAGVMALSWVAYRWAEAGARAGNRERMVLGLGLALVLAVVDLAMTVYQMLTSGLKVSIGSYASTWMALSGYHVFHLLLTFFIGLGVWNRARLGRFATNTWHVRLVGFWWNWVLVAAVIVAFTTSFTTSSQLVP
jgi:heme/copper-type cytochrome/quinol oxidase subunit 3